MHRDKLEKAIELIASKKDLIGSLLNEDGKRNVQFINNIAFALAEAGHS
jgi:hypothetical protein